MKTGKYSRGVFVIVLIALAMLSGCELFTGPTGATGAAGAEGPSVYLKTASGERIYSGGTFYLGEASANGSLSVSATFSLVNSTGHSIELTGSGYLVTGLKSCLSSSGSVIYNISGQQVGGTDYGITESVALSSPLTASAKSGNTFIITATITSGNDLPGTYRTRYTIPYRDTSTGESNIFSFEAYAILD